MLKIVFEGLSVSILIGKELENYHCHPQNMKKVNHLKMNEFSWTYQKIKVTE